MQHGRYYIARSFSIVEYTMGDQQGLEYKLGRKSLKKDSEHYVNRVSEAVS